MSTNEILNLRLIPLAETDFKTIRDFGKIYVDKTELIYNIALQRSPIFLARPRRFGKSLLIHTFESLFSRGLQDFKGLAIEKYWRDKTYQVVRLDFTRIAGFSPTDLNNAFNAFIIDAFNLDDKISPRDVSSYYPNGLFSKIVKTLPNKSLVLLIDEYDAPLVYSLDDPDKLKFTLETLRAFYSTVKEYSAKFRFLFITGVTRVAHVSIFSAFNNLEDLSFYKEYNALLGFTKNDLVNFFDPYIENAANVLNMSKNNVYARLESYYDGIKFVPNTNETVYNPWSILRFLKNPDDGFVNYWFKTSGTPSLIMQYLKVKDSFDYINYNDREIYIDMDKLSDRYEIENIPPEILLSQAGYFSPYEKEDGSVVLRPPNSEIEESLLRLYLRANNVTETDAVRSKRQTLVNDIDSHNLKNIVETFNTILNTVVSDSSKIFEDERSVRDIIFASILPVHNLEKFKKNYTLNGFADLELVTPKTHLVIEFKRTYPKDKNNQNIQPRDAKEALSLAIEQVKSHNYGKITFDEQDLYRVAMVISTEEKKILPDYCQEVID